MQSSKAMAGYHHDVFLSVKRDDTFSEWLRSVFIPLFESYLKQDVIVECRRQLSGIYFYEKNLRSGDIWPKELRDAIRGSCVLVALCSPEYFYSKWCLTEFASFHKRGKVVVPVSIHDGDAFPDHVKEIQAANLSDYVFIGEGFRRTELYVQLQNKLKQLSKDVARMLKQAPDYDDGWPVIETWPPGEEPDIPLQTLTS